MIAALDGMNGTRGTQQSQGADPRLMRAAQQFEAMMMKELLAPMSKASLEDAESEDTGVLGEFACESLAGGLSASGGLGIANQIVHTLSHSGSATRTEPVGENQPMGIKMSMGK